MSFQTEYVNGMANRKDKQSEQGCAVSTPKRPKISGNIIMQGIKHRPDLAEAIIEARTPLPIDCSIMFEIVKAAFKGSESICQRKATTPIAITAGSSLKNFMTFAAPSEQITATQAKNIVPYLTQNL